MAMKLYSLVLYCTSVHLVWQNGLLAVEYVHPGRNVTYECTASGGQFTVWRGSALGSQCAITLYHHHFGTKDAIDSCKNGTVVGQGIRREKDNYISLLTVFVSPDLNGKTIECHLINGGHGEIRISSTMLRLFLSALKPPVLKCKPHYLNSTRALVRLETTFDKIQPFVSSSGVKISVLSYTITYSASNSGNICESATISASSCDVHHIYIDVAVFANSTNGRGSTSTPLKREGINTFVNIRYDKERNTITCLFQNQPLYIRKECAVMYSGLRPKRRFGHGTSFVAINDTFLNTSCFEEVHVEARSGFHTPVSVIMDSNNGQCLIEAGHNIMVINVTGGVFGGGVVVVLIICILYACIKQLRTAATRHSQDDGLRTSQEDESKKSTPKERDAEKSVQLSLSNIIFNLMEVTEPTELGIHLGIKMCKLKKFQKQYPTCIDTQMIEVIRYWLRNSADCSWIALANAVDRIGGHGNLVERLKNMHAQ